MLGMHQLICFFSFFLFIVNFSNEVYSSAALGKAAAIAVEEAAARQIAKGITAELGESVAREVGKEAIENFAQNAAKRAMNEVGDGALKNLAKGSESFGKLSGEAFENFGKQIANSERGLGGQALKKATLLDNIVEDFKGNLSRALEKPEVSLQLPSSGLDDLGKALGLGEKDLSSKFSNLKIEVPEPIRVTQVLDDTLSFKGLSSNSSESGMGIKAVNKINTAQQRFVDAAGDVSYLRASGADTGRISAAESKLKTVQSELETAFKEQKGFIDKQQAAYIDDIVRAKNPDQVLKKLDELRKIERSEDFQAVSKLKNELKTLDDQIASLQKQQKSVTGGATGSAARETLEAQISTLKGQRNDTLFKLAERGNSLPLSYKVTSQLKALKTMGIKGIGGTLFTKATGIVNASFSALVMGFGFAFPSMIQSTIEQAIQARTLHDTISIPQKFGDIWMQIPRALLSGAADSVAYFPLYVGLSHEQTAKVTKRDDLADTAAYLQQASLFVSRDEYQNYAKSAIPSGDFPGKMVELHTGAHIIGSGALVPGMERIQLIGESKGARQEVLSNKIDDFVDEVEGGVRRQEYAEYRVKEVKYPGSALLGQLLDKQKNESFIKKTFPDLPSRFFYPAVFNNTIQALNNGTAFGQFAIAGFKALALDTVKKLGGTTAAGKKPYLAMGTYVYQTADTQAIKTVRTNIANTDDRELGSSVCEYVMMLDDTKQPTSLQLPLTSLPYNFPSWQLNPNVKYMLSLFDGVLYDVHGMPSASTIDAAQLISTHCPELAGQITAMRMFVEKRTKYGPFNINGKVLTIDKALSDAGVFVYQLKGGLENNGTDYFVATRGLEVVALPATPDYFVSLVTSRIYDGNLQEYTFESGYPDVDYTVYKASDEAPPLVVLGAANQQYGKPIVEGLKGPLETLFVDYDINPNKITAKDIQNKTDQEWLAQSVGAFDEKSGVITWPLPIPAPLQWVLSERGPQVSVGQGEQAAKIRIGAALTEKAKKLREDIDEAHEQWKIYMIKHGYVSAAERQARTYTWAGQGGLRSITVRATSAEDIAHGNFVYVSPEYPDEYLVFSLSKDALVNPRQFNPQSLQPYAVSLSTGAVYGRQENGERVGQLLDLDQLIETVQNVQEKMLESLQKNIAASRQRIAGGTQSQITFGTFDLYVLPQDIAKGIYIYADVTGMDTAQLTPMQIVQKTERFFISVDAPAAEGTASQTDQQMKYAKQIVAQTQQILNIVNGMLYNRGGTTNGFYRDYSIAADGSINVNSGYLDKIISAIEAEAVGGGKISQDIKNKITKLTQQRFDELLLQKEQVITIARAMAEQTAPLDDNTIANINGASLLQSFRALVPTRMVKEAGNNYYVVGYQDMFADNPSQVLTYLDINAGSKNKDNKRAVIYSNKGTFIAEITDAPLMLLRASLGIRVAANGKQTRDIPVFQGAIPVDGQSFIEINSAQLYKKIEAAVAMLTKKQQAIAGRTQLQFLAPLYRSAQTVDILRTKNAGQYALWYNAYLRNYVVKPKDALEERFIDLAYGYEYSIEGKPYIERSPLYVQTNGKGLLAIGVNSASAPIAFFSPDGTKMYRMEASDQVQGTFENGQAGERTDFFNGELGSVITYYSKSSDTYTVFLLENTQAGAQHTNEPEKIGVFKKGFLFYTMAQQVLLAEKDEQAGEPSENEVPGQLLVIWDGSPEFKVQKAVYGNQLNSIATIAGSEKSSNSTTFNARLEKVEYSPLIKSNYIKAIINGSPYYYVPIYSVLEPSMSADCSAESDVKHLDYWKRCRWKLNTVTNAYGAQRIVATLTRSALKTISISQRANLLQTVPTDRKPFVETALKKILYDPQFDRFVYSITADDKFKDFWQEDIVEGSYIDLSDGVIYAPTADPTECYPTRALLRTKLLMLLNSIELSVAPQSSAAGKPLFDSFGIPYIDNETQKILVGAYTLVYRGKAYLQDELKRIDDQFNFSAQGVGSQSAANAQRHSAAPLIVAKNTRNRTTVHTKKYQRALKKV